MSEVLAALSTSPKQRTRADIPLERKKSRICVALGNIPKGPPCLGIHGGPVRVLAIAGHSARASSNSALRCAVEDRKKSRGRGNNSRARGERAGSLANSGRGEPRPSQPDEERVQDAVESRESAAAGEPGSPPARSLDEVLVDHQVAAFGGDRIEVAHEGRIAQVEQEDQRDARGGGSRVKRPRIRQEADDVRPPS